VPRSRGVRQIADDDAISTQYDGQPSLGWSPDGTKIAYVGRAEGDHDDNIFVVDLTEQEELRASFPIWSDEVPLFKPFAPSSDEMWSEAGGQEVFLWLIEPDGPE
jgi:hypothetical protein